jgi:cytosine/adenosine deaminase-related metal-dependent hydrolase/ubiquinone/menaquinone biosynthesis C-methylase UbiE
VKTSGISASTPFDQWASVYDQQQNPLLQLEQRYLQSILPSIKSLDVLDVGCGTGRWLQTLATQSPNSLTGIDSSPQMLRHAATKLGDSAILHLGDCIALPVPARSTDLLLASFVLSYISDLEAFALECARVCRPDASLFLTDMHPVTQHTQNWKRSFQHGCTSIDIKSQIHLLQNIVYAFRAQGFELVAHLEPLFGLPEHKTLRHHGKLAPTTLNLPPIYLMQFQKNHGERSSQSVKTSLRFTGARVAHGPHEYSAVSIDIHDDRLRGIYANSITPHITTPSASTINLEGHLVLPGLINAHDHLEFGLFPNLGHGPYSNASQWAAEIHRVDAALIDRHRSIPRDVRLYWGAIRNLICGVTTVCHHNPLTHELLDSDFPVRVIRQFGWSHSLALDAKLVESFHATDPRHPFIVHAAEGTDNNSASEVFTLDNLQVLDSRTILVHGLALTLQAVDLLNKRDAAVVLCPSSNQFLFHSIPSHETVAALHNILIGSDSPLTAAGDLLDELSIAHKSLGLSAEEIYAMVATRAADILRLQSGEGRLVHGSMADLIAVKDKLLDPAATLVQLHFSDIELVILGGRIQLVSLDLFQRIPTHLRQGLHLIEINGHQRWIRAPLPRLFTEASNILGPEIRLSGRQVRHAGNL